MEIVKKIANFCSHDATNFIRLILGVIGFIYFDKVVNSGNLYHYSAFLIIGLLMTIPTLINIKTKPNISANHKFNDTMLMCVGITYMIISIASIIRYLF